MVMTPWLISSRYLRLLFFSCHGRQKQKGKRRFWGRIASYCINLCNFSSSPSSPSHISLTIVADISLILLAMSSSLTFCRPHGQGGAVKAPQDSTATGPVNSQTPLALLATPPAVCMIDGRVDIALALLDVFRHVWLGYGRIARDVHISWREVFAVKRRVCSFQRIGARG